MKLNLLLLMQTFLLVGVHNSVCYNTLFMFNTGHYFCLLNDIFVLILIVVVLYSEPM